jgi:hypothetical protein
LWGQGFWFGQFKIGEGTNYTMLVDTGSGDLILNPGVYVPGSSSKSLNTTFANHYGTTNADGSGTGEVSFYLSTLWPAQEAHQSRLTEHFARIL